MTDSRADGRPTALRWAVGQVALHILAVSLGFLCFVALFQIDLLPGIGILFYRGLALLIVAFVVTLGLALVAAGRLADWGVRRRDALGACILSLALNLGFLVLLPVTVDRSISVFVLAEMAAHPDEAYTAERMRGVFEKRYLGEYRQIDRRLQEQAASGNVRASGDAYVITPQGRAFIRLSRLVANAFRTDPRFVTAPPQPPQP
ncbi:hypothetical protein [Methylobacterium nigriterrae]|uniref:hypothetical protein n=1 Tax=Methylobacterium nigriterrae TaxID=3127512 RepID=UPI003013BD96